MSINFVVGQRWISNPEPELGLGIILQTQNRRVIIAFPAVEEERTYASDTAPLSRMQFEIGDTIEVPEHGKLTVADQQEHDGCIVYFAQNSDGDIQPIPEQMLGSSISLSGPKERFLAGQLEHHRRFELRAATLEHRNTYHAAQTLGLLGPRIQLLPHQIYIASEVARRANPRVLLADEVGLGKTIEAGLIIHKLLLLERAQRVLIIVPDSLVHQWLVEMLRRFNLKFSIYDEARCREIDEYEDDPSSIFFDEEEAKAREENPFEESQLIICAQDWLAHHPRRKLQLMDAGWDLLVVDEAHHLHWSEGEQASPEYQLVEQLTAVVPSVLLLTATPESTGLDGHFARLRLLDPGRFSSLQAFRDEQDSYNDISQLTQKLLSEPLSIDNSLQQDLAIYLEPQQLQTLISDPSTENIQGAIGDLLDRFGTGRMLFRNTRSSVGGFPRRVLHQHPLAPPSEFEQSAQEFALEEQLQVAPVLGKKWLTIDPRVNFLEKWLLAHPDEKLLLICHDADVALDLELHMRLRRGFASAVFHEGLSLIERDRAAAYFADEESGAQLLICSEIGSEGRNFQFSQHLMLFDLPLNADLLEQRIGRLDRIGQKGDVNIHVPFYTDSAQEKLLQWCYQVLAIFDEPCTIGEAMNRHYGEALQLACINSDPQLFNDLQREAQERAITLRASLHEGRNRLLELNSCKPAIATQQVKQLEDEQRSGALAEYLEQLADQFGLDHEEHSENAIILRPGDHMITEAFPHLPEEGISGTFDRERALSREDLAYLSWEHPLVRSGMDLILSSDFGCATICTLPVSGIAPGTLLLESFFSPTLNAPAWLQLQRYLPEKNLRLVLDNQLRELAAGVAHNKLNQLCKGIKKRLAPALLRELRETLITMLAKMETLAAATAQQWQCDAISHYNKEREQELQRLRQLQTRNHFVDEQALILFNEETAQGLAALQTLKLNMAALRLAIVSK